MDEAKCAEEKSTADEVPSDVMHLITVSSFIGLSQLIFALADYGALAPSQLEEIEDCMTAPLDDPDWRDDSSMAKARDLLERALASAMVLSLERWSRDSGPPESRLLN